ncbi:MAG: NYN domain-containing protein [Planctomycetes bacterium]|nr:NYN domain-containing protein [Planctomycetota bacterium]
MASRPRNGVSPAQRVAVLVDVQNMYYAAKNLYGGRVAYQRLFNHTLRRRGLVRAIAYIVSRPGSGQEAFFELLKAVGFELKIKEAAEMPDGSRKGNWDVGLALDAITLADRVDVIHLVSGDGDFTDLIYLVKSRGVRVEVSSFPESTSEQLIRAATQYYALNEEIIFGDTGPRMDGDGRPPRDRERGDRSGHRRDGRDRDRDAGPREPDAPREGRENADESAAPTPPAEPPTEDDDNRGNRLDEEPAWRAQPQFDASRPAPHEYTGSGRVIPERGKNFDSYQGQGGGYGGSRRHYGGGGGRYPRRGNSRGNPYDRGDDDRGNRR